MKRNEILSIISIILSSLCLILITAVLIVVCVKGNTTSKKEEESTYDVSYMNEPEIKTLINNLKNNKDEYIIYLGASSCSICEKLLPVLKEAQTTNNYVTQYIDIENVDRTTTYWQSFIELLNVKVTAELTIDGEDKEITDTYGNMLNNYGFAPMVLKIKNGKQVSGFIGYKDIDEFTEWLNED